MRPDEPAKAVAEEPGRPQDRMGCVAFCVAGALAAGALILVYVGAAMFKSDPTAQAAVRRLGSRLLWPAILSGGLAGWWMHRGDRGKARVALLVAVAVILAIPALVAFGPWFM